MSDNRKSVTEGEIRQKCEEIWVKGNSWNLTYDDLIRLSYVHGNLGDGRINGFDNKDSDTVYVSPNGHEMTRAMCSHWMNDWCSYSHGFCVAWRYLESQQGGI